MGLGEGLYSTSLSLREKETMNSCSLILSLWVSQHFHNAEALLEEKDPVVKVFETHCMLRVPSSTLVVAFSRL